MDVDALNDGKKPMVWVIIFYSQKMPREGVACPPQDGQPRYIMSGFWLYFHLFSLSFVYHVFILLLSLPQLLEKKG